MNHKEILHAASWLHHAAAKVHWLVQVWLATALLMIAVGHFGPGAVRSFGKSLYYAVVALEVAVFFAGCVATFWHMTYRTLPKYDDAMFARLLDKRRVSRESVVVDESIVPEMTDVGHRVFGPLSPLTREQRARWYEDMIRANPKSARIIVDPEATDTRPTGYSILLPLKLGSAMGYLRADRNQYSLSRADITPAGEPPRYILIQALVDEKVHGSRHGERPYRVLLQHLADVVGDADLDSIILVAEGSTPDGRNTLARRGFIHARSSLDGRPLFYLPLSAPPELSHEGERTVRMIRRGIESHHRSRSVRRRRRDETLKATHRPAAPPLLLSPR